VLCEFEGAGLAGVEGATDFMQFGINLTLLGPGEPMSMYHWVTATAGSPSNADRLRFG
jgi:hypothetical protein